MTLKKQSLGRRGEELARNFLEEIGYHILEKNYRTRIGEIDLISRDGNTLVFVEVKTRSSKQYGHPFEALTRKKCAQIARVALHYLNQHGLHDQPARFDVVGVMMGEKPKIEIVKNAFEVG